MPINSPNLPFTESLIALAPQTPGVFALWQDGAVVYYGKASTGSATIRSALDAHFKGRAWSGQRGLRCSWEIAANPDLRYLELLKEFESTHERAPRWNDPQRLPTGA